MSGNSGQETGINHSMPITIEPGTFYSTAGVAEMMSRKVADIPQVSEYEFSDVVDEAEIEIIYESESIEPYEEEYIYESQPVYFSEGFDSSFKAYMDYRCITDTGSMQYELQQEAYTDERGFRRIGNDYCVALGTGITNGCSERFLITLDSGYCFSAIVSDVKADIHTDSTNQYAPRGDYAGNVVEFIIDTDYADDYMLNCGSAGCYEDLSGNIVSIEKI